MMASEWLLRVAVILELSLISQSTAAYHGMLRLLSNRLSSMHVGAMHYQHVAYDAI